MLRNFLTLWLICLALVLLQAQDYYYIHYDVDNGLPSNHVYRVVEDKEGYMWFLTNNGVARFDGYSFTTYTVSNGLQSNDVWGAMEDAKGRMWMASFGKNFQYYKDGNFHNVNNDRKDEKLYTTLLKGLDINGGVYIADNPFLQYCDDSCTIIKDLQVAYSPIVYDYDGTTKALIRRDSQIYKLNRTSPAQLLSKINMTIPPNTFVWQFSQDSTLILTSDKIYTLLKDSVIQERTWKELGIDKQLIRCYSTNDTGLYKCLKWSDGSYAMIDNKLNITVPPYLNGSKKADLNIISIDRNENTWFATKNNGVFMLTTKAKKANNFIFEEDPSINSLALDEHGTLWMGSYGGNLYTLKNNKIIKSPFLERNNSSSIKQLLFNKGHLCMAQYRMNDNFASAIIPSAHLNKSLKTCPTRQIDFFEKNNIIIENNENAVLLLISQAKSIFANDKYVYLATIGGIYSVDFQNSSDITIQKISDGRSYAAAVKKDESIWVGRTTGLFTIDSNYNKTILNPLKQRIPMLQKSIWALAVDNADRIWAGTDGWGMYRFDGNTIHTISELKNEIVKYVYADKQDRIWAVSNTGAHRIKIKSYQPFNYQYTKISTAHGLISNAVNQILTKGDTIYIATDRGLTVLQDDCFRTNDSPAPLYLTSVLVNNRDTIQTEYLNLTHDQNNLTFHYVCLSYKSQGNIQYEYRLLGRGLDSTWQTTNARFREYSFLSPNDYIFEVRSKDIDGIASLNTQQFHFTIYEPWWQTYWFRGIVLCLIGGGIYWRMQVVREQEAEQTRIDKRFAALEMQALQAQMNPHFIFNALAAIQNNILKKDILSANNYLAKFARLMRLFLKSTRKKYISLEEEIQLLQFYIELELLRFPDKFDYEISVDESIDTQYVELPSMLVQPFVENAINHGLLYRSFKGKLQITFKTQKDSLIIVIEDNGVGREKTKTIDTGYQKGYQSYGLKIVQERLETLAYIEKKEAYFKIEDLKKEDGFCSGTLVKVIVPLIQ